MLVLIVWTMPLMTFLTCCKEGVVFIRGKLVCVVGDIDGKGVTGGSLGLQF